MIDGVPRIYSNKHNPRPSAANQEPKPIGETASSGTGASQTEASPCLPPMAPPTEAWIRRGDRATPLIHYKGGMPAEHACPLTTQLPRRHCRAALVQPAGHDPDLDRESQARRTA